MTTTGESDGGAASPLATALADIGIAAITTDSRGVILRMSPVAEALTGWAHREAVGLTLATVFRIESEAARAPLPDPLARVFATGRAAPLADHTVLIARDGSEVRIDHGAAPVRDPSGTVIGALVIFCDVSERLRVARGAEEARALAEGIVRTVREPLVVLGPDFRVRTANPSFYRTFGATPAGTEGRAFFDLGDQRWNVPELRALLEGVLARDDHFHNFEMEHDLDGPGRRSMVLNARRIPPHGAQPELMLLSIEDLTERRRTEERYRELFNSMDEGFCSIEILSGAGGRPDDFRYLETNPSFGKQTGMGAVVGKRVRELLPEVEQHWIDLYAAVADTGEPVRTVINVKSLDDRWFDVFVFRQGGPQSRTVGVLFTNVTARKRDEIALKVSEARYRRLFETAQDGILLVDPGTRRVFDANPFLTDLLGYTRDELVGKELWEIGLFRDIEANRAAFRTLQENGYIRYEDLPLRTHDGRGIEVEFVSNVYDVGDARVIQCNIRDVTDRKRAEHALRAAHDELEARVEARTAELARANQALTAEIDRRERAEAERRDLQGRLTTAQEDERRRIARELHDQMGQHLTALALGLKVVKDATPEGAPTRPGISELQALTDLIGQEVHVLALELRPTALDDLGLPAALANYAEAWGERAGIEVDFQSAGLDAGRLPVPVETALYRVVQEALTNVLKHAQARHVSVVLQGTPGHVVAVVEDDGRGFDTERGPGAADGVYRLGLLGMGERMELIGGTLTVESAPGRGTTVLARVPLPNTNKGVAR